MMVHLIRLLGGVWEGRSVLGGRPRGACLVRSELRLDMQSVRALRTSSRSLWYLA